MTFSDIPFRPSGRVLRQFAGAWLVFFLALAAWQWWRHGNATAAGVLAGVAVTVGGAGLLHPPLLRWLFVGWMVLVFPIGWLVSQTLLLVVYFLILTPLALFFRLTGRDILLRRPRTAPATWWLPKETPADIGRYFRQY